MAKLSEYSAKRRFEATPEPAPAEPAHRGGPLLFVVQQHAARRLHYDFRIECDGVLFSWAVPKGPSLDPADKRMAVFVENHPYDYASFEGVIPPKQYGAGEVIVWDCGVYSPDEDGVWFHDREQAQQRVREGLVGGKLSLQLRGLKLKGSFALVRTKQDEKSWLLIKHKDRFISAADVTQQDRSVLSGVAVKDMRSFPVHRMPASQLVPVGDATAMPAKLEPMQAELGDAPFQDAGWMWEPKLDGYRVLAFVDGDKVQLRSRRGLELANTFPRLAEELRQQAGGGTMILDGEIVALGADGKPSFNALQNRFQLKSPVDIATADRNVPTLFFAFDLLYFAGLDLRARPYHERRRYLAQCLMPSALVQLVHADEDGESLHAAALASGFEGVIGKRKDSRYEAGKRSPAWLKVKPTHSADLVIGGYTKGKGSRGALGSLLIGYWEGDGLRYASHVGSGFNDRALQEVLARLEPLHTRSCPFSSKPEVNAPVTWVKPELVAEVDFQEWTDDGSLRAPVFQRLRDDIDPKTVRREVPSHSGAATKKRRSARAAPPSPRGDVVIDEVVAALDGTTKNAFELAVGTHRIRLSNLDRVYWPANEALQQPALTKRDLLRYLAQVSPLMLPHIADRPLTMIRMPDGITGQRFFQKHWEQARPDFVESVTVFSESKDEHHNYLLCNNLPTLLWLAQSGTLEFHVWHSRAKVDADAKSKSTDYATSLESLEASVLNCPDYVVFDIDPYIYSGKEAPGAEPELNTIAFEKGKEIAFALRELLLGMKLEPIVKTSGKTGLHVFVPIRRTIDFDTARHVSELVSRHLMRQRPREITMEWSVPKRSGKIFMDHNMNVRGKTLNVAYSPRGEPGAPVSMPLTWEELASAHPLDFRMTSVIKRLTRTGDRWRDALTRKQDLDRALKGGKA
ncbi:DNA ligase D [Lysobacter sp. Root494]|uniref:DNA ligase D n=1 Tax=Lysobacter sp. Root494 TaxID=1736549 RepID=UPI0006F23F2D|nr:DNA ligase D [Lysobacter sp. Root494]KQY54652.1 ATP-dependent DNA ligase [Lysobacter sp. Root494]